MKSGKKLATHNDMRMWQFRTIMAELGQVTLHASDDSCPCNQVDLGADGKHHPEYCLGKHLLNVQSLCLETALMDEPHRDMLEEMASGAFKHHEAAKTIYCEGGTWPDLAQWSRDARKKIEPIYYSCDAGKLKEEPLAQLFEKVTPAPEVAYDASLEAFRKASREFTAIRNAYRAKEIGDEEYLKGKTAFDKASQEADAAEEAYIKAKAIPKAESKAKATQSRLFEYSWLAQKIDKCNLNTRDVDAALNFRPLRNLVAYAVGTEAKVSLCAIGLVYGIYQVTIDEIEDVAVTDMLNAIAKKGQKNIKRIYTPVPSQRIYEVVVPKNGEKTELTFAPQEVSMMPARRDPAEQVAMFEEKAKAKLNDVFTVSTRC